MIPACPWWTSSRKLCASVGTPDVVAEHQVVPFRTTCPLTLRASDLSTAYSTSRIRSVHNPMYCRKCSHSSLIVFSAM